MNVDYSYLRPSPNHLHFHHPSSYIMKVENNVHKRKIFYNVQFDSFEKQQIQKLRQLLKKQGKNHKKEDPQLLRFCYASDFNLTKSIQKIDICQQWKMNFNIQNLSQNAKKILQQGVFYTYGRDYHQRPIIILNIAKVDMNKYKLQDYYCAMNNLFKPIKQFMFVPGLVQNWNIIIDTQQKTNLPITDISRIIQKLSTVYSSSLERLFIVNLNSFFRFIWLGIKNIIHSETQKKIQVLGPNEMNKIFKHLQYHEVEKKYGGKLQNLTQFWPIKTTAKNNHEQTSSKVEILNASEYESIDNNYEFFEMEAIDQNSCCINKCQIF